MTNEATITGTRFNMSLKLDFVNSNHPHRGGRDDFTVSTPFRQTKYDQKLYFKNSFSCARTLFDVQKT